MKKRKASRRLVGRERRRFKRYQLKRSVSYCILKLPSPERMIELLASKRKGRVHDISQGGICFHAQQMLLPGTVVRIDIPRSPLGKPIRKRARVVWTREIRPNNFRVGVRFL